ncbi:TetR/AcrR family transcriptional regulator [Conexibacter sp. CPCC 206217]|uniref:TetR/AcrR family transcriptional regulator n=1 Tax=Conexibacter sp. CPCC 206217 TaxID=3064574 RepID=UPI00271C8385|nr:TetR/AcrR family transcriptional regulator [Conexibacter sp. CPCC 206217]MDO8212089.1 TetR/AcrR family transcriptional regulator [Conexibacter sp. CPCC 206217]
MSDGKGAPTPDLTRPKSVRAHDAVLQATRELLQEGGLPAATVDEIARRSGVSKATIYNHWPSRTAVAAEAFGGQMADAIPLPDIGSATGDLTEQARRVAAFYASDAGTVFAQLLAAGTTDPHAGEYFRDFFLVGRREAIRTLWDRARRRGEVRSDVDVETAIDLLFGPLIFRLLSGHAPLDADAAEAIADAALHGLLAQDTAK